MTDRRDSKASDLEKLRIEQEHMLWIVLGINLTMFFVEFGAGWVVGSTALLADSLDMLGDAFIYGFSLYVLERGDLWHARAALTKGWVMAIFGVVVLAEAGLRFQAGVVPLAPQMAAVGALALVANAFCFGLLWRHRSDDINLHSTWLCSRNDLMANTAVILAAGGVAWTGALWPDLAVGLAIAALFLRTASSVVRESLGEIARCRAIETKP